MKIDIIGIKSKLLTGDSALVDPVDLEVDMKALHDYLMEDEQMREPNEEFPESFDLYSFTEYYFKSSHNLKIKIKEQSDGWIRLMT